MQYTAKIVMKGRSQDFRLPEEVQFTTSELSVWNQCEEEILFVHPTDWSDWLASGPVASEEFMDGVEDLPVWECSIERTAHRFVI
jgi:antitoxin VapB